jgi:hypothetical protein
MPIYVQRVAEITLTKHVLMAIALLMEQILVTVILRTNPGPSGSNAANRAGPVRNDVTNEKVLLEITLQTEQIP